MHLGAVHDHCHGQVVVTILDQGLQVDRVLSHPDGEQSLVLEEVQGRAGGLAVGPGDLTGGDPSDLDAVGLLACLA